MNNFPNSSQEHKTNKAKETHRRTYNTRQLAECLGVSRDTIRNMRDDGELPPVIPTKRRIVRWTVDDIDLWFELDLSLIHISEPTRQEAISYAVFCLKKKN